MNTHIVCWRCVEEPVDAPLDMCDGCARQAEDDQEALMEERDVPTHERTHEKHRADFNDRDLDRIAYERWTNGR